jgi:transcriptional regulator with XRE-family HTH domain
VREDGDPAAVYKAGVTLGEALSARMDELGRPTLEVVADRVGVSQPTISRWLQCDPPALDRAHALAEFLGLDVDQVTLMIVDAKNERGQRSRRPRGSTTAVPSPEALADLQERIESIARRVEEAGERLVRIEEQLGLRPTLEEAGDAVLELHRRTSGRPKLVPAAHDAPAGRQQKKQRTSRPKGVREQPDDA